MIAKAQHKHLGISPQKVRLVVNQIRGKQVEKALAILRFSPKMAARDVAKVLKSAVANAEQREERVDVDLLRVSRAYVDVGPTLKRVRFRAMGRLFRILKRSCHVTLELDVKPRTGAGAVAAEPPDGSPRKRAAAGAKPGKAARRAGAKGRARGSAAASGRSRKKTAKAGSRKKTGKKAAPAKKKAVGARKKIGKKAGKKPRK